MVFHEDRRPRIRVERPAGAADELDGHTLPFCNLVEVMGDGVAQVVIAEAPGADL